MESKTDVTYLYEMKNKDVLLTLEEEKIMRALRRLNTMWKKYKSKPEGNKLILYCGMGCDVRYSEPFVDNVIEAFEHITCDGGDGSDNK